MARDFHSFVVFAEMRTGSNFLERNLNALDGVSCLGEAFNPHFIGYPNKDSLLGMTQAQRDNDPASLLDKIEKHENLAGFRYFHDHDPRILDRVLEDQRCAKIILTRDPVESYVSWQIARSTGQWKLTDINRRKEAKAEFDPVEFREFLGTLADFQALLTKRLQISGQTAFRLRYQDLQSLDVLNGLARFLGLTQGLEKLDTQLKVQNPEPIANKVSNPEEMAAALTMQNAPDLWQVADFEPRRFAVVPTYILGAKTPLIYQPIRSGPQDRVSAWMAALDGVRMDDLPTGYSQKQLRQWKRTHKGHRSFTVLRHPVLRAHHAYCTHILGTGPRVYKAIRATLVKRYGLPIPLEGPNDDYDTKAHRAGFAAFLSFLKGNLNGQTAVRVDPTWCSQSLVVQGFSGFSMPDLVMREEELPEVLPALVLRMGIDAPPFPEGLPEDKPFGLAEIYDDEIETLAASAYQRDYMIFGFDRWR